MSRKMITGIAITMSVLAVIAVLGWGWSTNWTFQKEA